jgi:hypothetical protein
MGYRWKSVTAAGIPVSPDNISTVKKIVRDEDKPKEELIEELLDLRQRVAELEEIEARLLGIEKREMGLVKELPGGLNQVKGLKGLLPICSSCKRIRDDGGFWNQLEMYIREHSEAEFSHGLCPECVKKFYPVDILTSDKDLSGADQ